MSILCDVNLKALMDKGLIQEPDYNLVNPASIDIRVGTRVKREIAHGRMEDIELTPKGLVVSPGDFLLVDMQEYFNVPADHAMHLFLKSPIGRRGWGHAMASWVDPGWQGRLTMEIRNVLQYNSLILLPGQRFAQVVVHKLSCRPASRPYEGRYMGATAVEEAKESS